MPIGAFFCRAGWYRPSMRPAAPVKMTSGMGSVDLVDYPDSKKIAVAAGIKNADFRTATYAGVGRFTPADYYDGEDA